ncbi:MAG: glycosyltransferase family 39 protein [Candidatus Omnitrophica bacterium]|nr:glycosyltransferase family 39 protein [Candidatus Omnitrophota bacterium]
MIFLLAIVFLLTRILHLLYCFPEPFTEELQRGTIAKELIQGLKIPFFDYAADHYSGGSLVYGVLTVPSFLVFGKSVFVLRLTALFFQLGTFLTWALFMKRFFGRKAALYIALLYLFSPPYLTLYAMYAMGVHAESLLFTALGLFFLFRILYDGKHSLRCAAWLGLVEGFGTYFSYQQVVSLACFILFWCYEDRRLFRKKEFYLFLLFFLVGFSPWLLYNGLYGFHGFDRVKEAFVYSSVERPLIIPFRFLKLATLRLIQLFSFNYREGTHVLSHITLFNIVYYAALFFSYGILCQFEKENKKIYFFFLFPLFFLSAASLSRFHLGIYEFRYYVPLFPFFFAVIALALVRLGNFSRIFQKVSLGILILLLGMGCVGELNLLRFKEFALSLKHRGYSYRQLGWALAYRHGQDLNQLSDLIKALDMRLSPSERFDFHLGLSQDMVYRPETLENLEKLFLWVKQLDRMYQPFYLKEIGNAWSSSEKAFLKRIDYWASSLGQEDQPYFVEGLIGSLEGLPFRMRLKQDRIFGYVLRQVESVSPQNQKALVYALGKHAWGYPFADSFLDKMKRHRDIENRFQEELLPLYYQGVGALLATLFDSLLGEWPFLLNEKLKGVDEKWKEAIFWGAGFEAPLLFEDPYEYKRMAKAIPVEWRGTFEQGLSDRFAWGGRNYWIEEELNITSVSRGRRPLLE